MARNYYQGKFVPKNPHKYKGNVSNIVFRSGWEAKILKWCDENSSVVEWGSEELVIHYVLKTDGTSHRYFPDLYVKFENGSTYIIEIKPKSQTMPPKRSKGKAQDKYLAEALEFTKNISKWEAALEYCKRKGYKFAIWTEESISKLTGTKI